MVRCRSLITVSTVGRIYDDCRFHPVRCTVIISEDEIGDISLEGVALTDGRWPSSCSVAHCGPVPLTEAQGEWIVANQEEYVARRMAGEEPEDILPTSLHGP
jgi:hypothetical protein